MRIRVLKLLVASVCLLACASTVSASDINKCVDATGRVVFSDAPCNESQSDQSSDIDLRINVVDGTAVSGSATASTGKAEQGVAVVLLSNGDEVELETKSMKSQRGLTFHLHNNLMLPNGIDAPYSKMKRIRIKPGADENRTVANIEMKNGKSDQVVFDKPVPYITGESALGRFSERLYNIERVDFY